MTNAITIRVLHYGPDKNLNRNDQSIIWVVIDDDESDNSIGHGYISNPFPQDYFLSEGKFKRQEFSGKLIKTVVMEASNGGRTNPNTYQSLLEYLADPLVKELCRDKSTRALYLNPGDPDRVNYIRTFCFDAFDTEYTVEENDYNSIVPVEWFREFYADIIANLAKCDVWSSAELAIENTVHEDDLFGERLFPVLKAPKNLTGLMQTICYNFKSYSDPLTDDEFVYIGIRSKSSEIDTVYNIYESGGFILKNQQWDWS